MITISLKGLKYLKRSYRSLRNEGLGGGRATIATNMEGAGCQDIFTMSCVRTFIDMVPSLRQTRVGIKVHLWKMSRTIQREET